MELCYVIISNWQNLILKNYKFLVVVIWRKVEIFRLICLLNLYFTYIFSERKFRPKVGAIDSKDINNSCNDRSLNCQSLAKRGFCSEIRYQRLIKIQCQQTCGFCTSILLSETSQLQKEEENVSEKILDILSYFFWNW